MHLKDRNLFTKVDIGLGSYCVASIIGLCVLWIWDYFHDKGLLFQEVLLCHQLSSVLLFVGVNWSRRV